MTKTPGIIAEEIIDALSRQFPGAPREQLDTLYRETASRKFNAKQAVFFKGDPSPCAYLLVSGRVYIYADSAAGNRVILNVITPGQLFGEIGVLDEGMRSAHAEAAKKSEVLVIPAASLQDLIQQSPEPANRLMQLITSRLRNTTEQMNDAGLFDTGQRLARLLLRILKQSNGDYVFDLKFSQTDLAALTATSRETVNRHLNEWRREGILTIQGRQVTILNIERLRNNG